MHSSTEDQLEGRVDCRMQPTDRFAGGLRQRIHTSAREAQTEERRGTELIQIGNWAINDPLPHWRLKCEGSNRKVNKIRGMPDKAEETISAPQQSGIMRSKAVAFQRDSTNVRKWIWQAYSFALDPLKGGTVGFLYLITLRIAASSLVQLHKVGKLGLSSERLSLFFPKFASCSEGEVWSEANSSREWRVLGEVVETAEAEMELLNFLAMRKLKVMLEQSRCYLHSEGIVYWALTAI